MHRNADILFSFTFPKNVPNRIPKTDSTVGKTKARPAADPAPPLCQWDCWTTDIGAAAECSDLSGKNPELNYCPHHEVELRLETQPASAWQRLTLCETTRGKLQVEVIYRGVWVWDAKKSEAWHWHLIVRREVRSPEKVKCSMSNAPEEASFERLAEMQGQRYWVEQSSLDGKNQAELGDSGSKLAMATL